MNKVLIKLYVPISEQEFDIKIPLNRKVHAVIKLIVIGINQFSGGYYKPDRLPLLYDKLTAEPFDMNALISETTIRNGTELILI